jgi:demethylmenaquinone methyltransferase/2-methoxy-6-polyprenyl-1,4-benzoquinol methylase
VIPALGQIVTSDRDSYRYLVESIRRFPDADSFAAMVAAAGFDRVRVRPLSLGIVALTSGWRL